MNILQRLKWFKKQLRWNYKYKKGKWDFMGNEELRYNTIVNYINQQQIPNAKILDLGCGYGSLLDYLPPTSYSHFTGIDLASAAIQRAKNKNYPNAEFQTADIHTYKPQQQYDFIIFNEVLYYLDNQLQIVEKYAHYFNKPGYYVFSFYGIREDLIVEIEKKYTLLKKEIISQSENVFWGICLYKID